MPYVNNQIIHDADSHIFENPEFFRPYASDELWSRMPPLYTADSSLGVEQFDEAHRLQQNPDFRAASADEVMSRKLWEAPGAWDSADRTAAIDAMGFTSQIVYDSFLRGQFRVLERGDDMDLLYDMAWCHVQAMLDFGSADPRMLPAGYIPLADPGRTITHMQRALDAGCRVVEVPADCPRDHSPAHADLEPFWRMAAEASVPVMFHLGGGRLPDPAFKVTGRRVDLGFVGGDGTFNSLEYLGAPLPFIETLNALIVDGVLERNPDLQIGVVEYGASWVPGYLRFLDTAHHAYSRLEERLQQLSLKPSEYACRQVKFAPFHFEDVGWLIEQSDPRMYLFSSDFPHKEGGRDPIAKFDGNFDLRGTSDEHRERFYRGNFEELFGHQLASV